MRTHSSDPLTYPIGVVARRTGLKPDLVRAWERRYGAVEPERTPGRQRVYSEEDIERLDLLRRATESGHPIGRIARLGRDELERLVAHVPDRVEAGGRSAATDAEVSPDEHLATCLEAVERLADDDLERRLESAAVDLGRQRLMEEVLAPLMRTIGERWREGTLRPIHEHLASAAVRSFTGSLRSAAAVSAWAPRLIVTTPAGQLHELGALLAASAAESEGWQVAYLGPNLPAEEIAAAARLLPARAVVLSLTLPLDAGGREELRRLRRGLGPEVAVVVGGRSATSGDEVLEEIGAHPAADLAVFRRILAELWG